MRLKLMWRNYPGVIVTTLMILSLMPLAMKGETNEFLPGALWFDDHHVPINAHGGGILEDQGIYYWFGEHKIQGPAGNDAHVGVHVYSSRDLYHWQDQGIALKISHDPASDIAEGCILERPKVIHCPATGKYVMWFHLEPKGQGYGAARTGVAVADQPIGPFRFLGSFRPNAGAWPMNVPDDEKKPLTDAEKDRMTQSKFFGGTFPNFPTNLIFRRDCAGGQMSRDMTLFVDDDGSAYQIYSSEENSALQISKLSDDFLKPAGKYIRVFPGGFNEAPVMFKYKGKYYLITSGCTGWHPNAARLAVADSIWGPWKQLGNPCVGKGADQTFQGQSTCIFPVMGHPGQFIFMADRWHPEDAINGRYLWLPIQFNPSEPFISWLDHWNLGFFDK
ncbi:MAG TPA: glycoside hydrolase family 43 protein [Verrucomicrobiae bacterium]